LRSGEAVSNTEITSEISSALAFKIADNSSLEPSPIATGSLAVTWIAPLIARTFIGKE
jgi:hypothetical protein